MKYLLFISFCVLSLSVQSQQLNKWERFSSPDEKLEFVLTTGEELTYSVKSFLQPVISDAKLGLKFKDLGVLGTNMVFDKIEESSHNETWTPILAKNKLVEDNYNQVHIYLRETVFPGRTLQIIVRLYNDGIAFKYRIDDEMYASQVELEEELTQFAFWMNTDCWAADYGSYRSHQEAEFKKQAVSDIGPDAFIGLPLLAKSGTKYVAVTEAALKNWPGLYLKGAARTKTGAVLQGHLSKKVNEKGKIQAGTIQLPAESPWRVVMVADKQGELIESDIIQNLNEPSIIEDPSWIKPGLCAWDSWWSRGVDMTNASVKKYIDLASENNFPYMLIDTDWYGAPNRSTANVLTLNPNISMWELLRYAKSKNVRLWLWLHHEDLNRSMENAFKLYNSWGIAGVKIDFMARDDMDMVKWYHETLALAAKYKLMVNLHGAYKPTGIRRTYPNLLTREGVLGNEYNKWSYRVTPEHNVTIPFTRMLAGPMDYTPGGFQNRGMGEFKPQLNTLVMGTRCHELAKFVVYESPLTTVCDHPDNYKNQGGMDLLRRVPTIWDETKVLDGEIGEFIIIARRKDTKWYIAGMTNSKARDLSIDLKVLDSNSTEISLWKDKVGESYTDLIERKESLSEDQVLLVSMAPGGGFVVIME